MADLEDAIAQTLPVPQEAPVPPPDILGFLAQILGPQSAEAAGPPDAWTQAYKQQQLAAQEQARRNQESLRQQALAQQAQLAQQRQQPKPTQAIDPAQLSKVLGGNFSATSSSPGPDSYPDMPITFGTTPGTGTPYFTNLDTAPAFAQEKLFEPGRKLSESRSLAPEELQKLRGEATAKHQQEQAAQAQKAKEAQGAGTLDSATIAKVTELDRLLQQTGATPELRKLILENTFPAMNAANREGKALTPETVGKLWKFNPETRDFDPVPPDLTHLSGKDLQEQGYRVYSDKQRGIVDELKDVDVAFQQLRSSVKDISGKNALELKASQMTGGNIGGPEGAVFKKAATNFTTIFDKFLGGVRGAASPQMQAIRSQVLPSIISTGAVSDRLMNDLDQLIQTMGDSRLKSAVGGQQFNAADMDKQAEKVLATYQKEAGKAAPAGKPTTPGAPAQAQGLQQGYVPMLNAQGKPVQVRAELVQQKLQQGYKPFQQ